MDYIFDDWKSLLEKFQNSVQKDLEAIHQQKEEVQQMKTDIFNRLDEGQYYRDDNRIVISAPEIIIGNVSKSGDLIDSMGKVVVKGCDVSVDGVGENGTIISRAPRIRQLAVNPGIDGQENVVCTTSEVVTQACEITLEGNDATDAFSQVPASAGKGGIRIHADKSIAVEASLSSEKRKESVESAISGLTTQISDLEGQMATQKSIIDNCFTKLKKLYEQEAELNDVEDFFSRLNGPELDEVQEQISDNLSSLYHSTQNFIHTVSALAEANRKKKALETEKNAIVTGDDFIKKTTGASMTIVAEHIDVSTADADGNLHTNDGAGISIRTPNVDVSMIDDSGALVEGSHFDVHTENVNVKTLSPANEGKELPAVGSVSVISKDITLEAVDYQMDDEKKVKEKQLADDGKVNITAKTVEVNTTNPKDVERDERGKLSKGEYTAEGDVVIRSKTINMETLDYEVADGALKTKALTKDSSIQMRSEKIGALAADAEGKATGSISLNAKAVSVKSMDVDKEKLTDSALAAGSMMTLVSEKMYVGAQSKDVKSKKLQGVSEEMGLFADKTFEAQQGDGKAVLQLDGGNASVGGSKAQVYGATTINGKTEVKDELKAPKATIDNLEAKSSFKSSNISDGVAVPGAGGGGSLSAKLKTEDAPKSE